MGYSLVVNQAGAVQPVPCVPFVKRMRLKAAGWKGGEMEIRAMRAVCEAHMSPMVGQSRLKTAP